MGQGGGVQLLNATPYDWMLNGIESRQMETWTFPVMIPPGSIHIQYVEFSRSRGATASAIYTLNGTGLSFQLRAADDPDYDIAVDLLNIRTARHPDVATVHLGWNHDGDVYFVLGGEVGNFGISVMLCQSWMQDNLAFLGNRPLRHLCMPGSHDAGMSEADPFIASPWTVTQKHDIFGQLHRGSRYFDIRPVLDGIEYRTGHYKDNNAGSAGADGQSIASIVSDVNRFTAEYAELIVLYVSHDHGPFEQPQWNGLFTALSQIQHRYLVDDPRDVDLTKLTLHDFIGDGVAAVVIIIDPVRPSTDLGNFLHQGFYPASASRVIDNYANTDSEPVMKAFQYEQMQQHRANPDESYFLLSWTLTQQPPYVFGGSIQVLSASVNADLRNWVLEKCTARMFPNILYTDFFFPEVTVSAMYINTRAGESAPRLSPPFAVASTGDVLSLVYRSQFQRLWMSTAGPDRQWSTPVVLPSGINSLLTPAAAAWNGNLAVLYRGAGLDQKLWFTTQLDDWHHVRVLNETTLAAPALIVYKGIPTALFLSSAGNGFIHGTILTDGQWRPSLPLPFPFLSHFTPAIAVREDILYVVYRSLADSSLLAGQWDGLNWSPIGPLPQEIATLWSPAMTGMKGMLHVAYMSVTDKSIWTTSSADNAKTWSAPVPLPESATTLRSPAIVAANGKLHVLYAAADDPTSVWQTSSSDGMTWDRPTRALTAT